MGLPADVFQFLFKWGADRKKNQRERKIEECAGTLKRYSDRCRLSNRRNRYYTVDMLAEQLGANSHLLREVLKTMKERDDARETVEPGT
jgi:hypothetical protein